GGDVRGVHAGVVGIAAGSRAEQDCVSHVAVVDGVIDAGDRDRLRQVPVGGGEREARHGRVALCGVVRGHGDDDVGGGLARQLDLERGLAAGFTGDEARGGRHRDAGGIVVRVRHRHVGRVHAGVVGIAAGGGAEHDAIGDVAVVHGVVHTGDRDRLRHVPVGGGEREAGTPHRALARIAGGDGDDDGAGGLALEHDLERGGAGGFGGDEARGGRDRDAGAVVVGV